MTQEFFLMTGYACWLIISCLVVGFVMTGIFQTSADWYRRRCEQIRRQRLANRRYMWPM